MSNKIIRLGSSYRLIDDDDVQVFDTLPARTYTVTFDEFTKEYGLTTIEDFTIPDRLYGSTVSDADRILNTFLDRPESTGVHLSGIKGSGKTLLAKTISSIAKSRLNLPTIVINQPFFGDGFNKFIQSINIPAVVMFDEFEKVYEWSDQDKILTLLDGVYPSKKLFIITSNDHKQINHYLRNRPGRIYYNLTFNSLSVDFVVEYCEENLNNKEHIDSISKYVSAYPFFSFDMLAAVIEEMNRYDQNLIEVLDFLNVEPESGEDERYTISCWIDGEEAVLSESYMNFEPNRFHYDLWPNELDESKVSDSFIKTLTSFYKTPGASSDNYVKSDNYANDSAVAMSEYNDYITITSNDFVSFEPSENKFVYEIHKGAHTLTFTVTRNPKSSFNYQKYLI